MPRALRAVALASLLPILGCAAQVPSLPHHIGVRIVPGLTLLAGDIPNEHPIGITLIVRFP
jgi:hypothetical protein